MHRHAVYLGVVHSNVATLPHVQNSLNVLNHIAVRVVAETRVFVLLRTRSEGGVQTFTTRLETAQIDHAREDATESLLRRDVLELRSIVVLVLVPGGNQALEVLNEQRRHRPQIEASTI